MKKKTWLVDALLGALIVAFTAGSYLLQGGLLESLELKGFDMRAKFRQTLETPADVVIIAIDDDSIARIGRWPWTRTRIAEMVDLLAAAKPRVIGLDILYSEPEINPAIAEIENLKNRYGELLGARSIVQKKGVDFALEFSSIAVRLDTDSRLLASIGSAGNVLLPMFFAGGGTLGAKPEPLPVELSSSTLTTKAARSDAALPPPVEGSKPVYPILPFLQASAGVGHVSIYPDLDGTVRREVPAVKYGDVYLPSYALALTARYLGLKPEDVVVTPGREVQLGKLRIPLDDAQSMMVTFNGPDHTFRYYSFHEVMNGKVSMDVFKDKIVLLGPSAAGVATLYVTPVAQSLPSVEFIANVIDNILRQRFLVRPEWAVRLELGLIAFCGLFIMFGLPRLRAVGGATVTALLLAGVLGAGGWLFIERGEWVKVVYPAFLLVAGYLVIQTKRFIFTEKGKELVEASAIETNKMLGLSFQGQGMLDLAFEKFRLCPLDDHMKETLYNLGLDFERKRQYAKAVNVYKHISGADPKYKDIPEKIKTLGAAAEGAVFGGIGQKNTEGTVMITGGASKPMLGRYEILKELGRGAMGIVYLGKDPKINRQVAIKTLMLEEGSSPEETKQIKERFFREAESAGTLNHPNIVRIFDAGEEQDVCFIAMELLDGHDLTGACAKDKLLDPLTALEYVAKVADGLDFAHAQGIVHRDIKPANIMLLKDGSIRVADFGIARITASSKTATGTVMGTPSYMSPEQIAGRKVDGRSDIFSLGVTLFELLTGEKPFKGGEGIGTLLFQIANEPEPEPTQVNPKLANCVSRVVHKALKKNVDERYQTGAELAKDLRACIELIKSGKDEPVVAAAAPAAAGSAAAPAVEPVPAVQVELPPQAAPAAEPVAAEPAVQAASFELPPQAGPIEIRPSSTPSPSGEGDGRGSVDVPSASSEPASEPATVSFELPPQAVPQQGPGPVPADEPKVETVSFELPPQAVPQQSSGPVLSGVEGPAPAAEPTVETVSFELPPQAVPSPADEKTVVLSPQEAQVAFVPDPIEVRPSSPPSPSSQTTERSSFGTSQTYGVGMSGTGEGEGRGSVDVPPAPVAFTPDVPAPAVEPVSFVPDPAPVSFTPEPASVPAAEPAAPAPAVPAQAAPAADLQVDHGFHFEPAKDKTVPLPARPEAASPPPPPAPAWRFGADVKVPEPSAEIELGTRTGTRPLTPEEIASALPAEPHGSPVPEEPAPKPVDPDATIRLQPPEKPA